MRPQAVHPWQPRFAQAITGMLALEALVFQTWPAVAVALALVVIALVAPRWSPVNAVFRLIARPPTELEPVAPVRFSQFMAVGALFAALVFLLVGPAVVGWSIVGAVAFLGLLSGITGICVGCELYRLLLLRSTNEEDVRPRLGLEGGGPWLVVLTAPGCTRCEPTARALESVAAGAAVTRVDLSRRPEAAAVGVRSVPAVLAVDTAGRLRIARVGTLGTEDFRAVVAAIA
jgi:Domain of unknown function (DUF4395)